MNVTQLLLESARILDESEKSIPIEAQQSAEDDGPSSEEEASDDLDSEAA